MSSLNLIGSTLAQWSVCLMCLCPSFLLSATAVYDMDIVEVYHQFQHIALHRRSYKNHGFTTTGEHMPAGHQQFFEQKGWTPVYFLQKAAQVGAAVHRYMDEVLKGRAFTEQTYNYYSKVFPQLNEPLYT